MTEAQHEADRAAELLRLRARRLGTWCGTKRPMIIPDHVFPRIKRKNDTMSVYRLRKSMGKGR